MTTPATPSATPQPTPLTDAFVLEHAPIITGKQWTTFARDLERQLAAMRAERDKAVNFCICAYCKTELPKDTNAVMLHMQECAKHPLGDALRSEVALKEQLALCESQWREQAELWDKMQAELTADLTRVTAERDEALAQLDEAQSDSACLRAIQDHGADHDIYAEPDGKWSIRERSGDRAIFDNIGECASAIRNIEAQLAASRGKTMKAAAAPQPLTEHERNPA